MGDNTDSGSLCYDKWKHAKSLKVLRNFAADTLTEDQFKSLTASNIQVTHARSLQAVERFVNFNELKFMGLSFIGILQHKRFHPN